MGINYLQLIKLTGLVTGYSDLQLIIPRDNKY